MKKFISIAATLLLAASTTSVFARVDFLGHTCINVNQTWYRGAMTTETSWCSGGEFNGKNLGPLTHLTLGGQAQTWEDNGNGGGNDWKSGTVTMHYSIKYKNTETPLVEGTCALDYYKFQDNNNWFQSGGKDDQGNENWTPQNINISTLQPGNYELSIYFENEKRDPETDAYTAYFSIGSTLFDNQANTIIYTTDPIDVVIQGRTLKKDGNWNTLCLPFNLSSTEIANSVLAGADIRTLVSSSFTDRELTLSFSENNLNKIVAGTPYLIKWTKPQNYDYDPGTYDIHDPGFTGVNISTTTATSVETDFANFKGCFSPCALTAGDQTILYLGASNTLYYPSSDVTINSFRAYFELKGITAGPAASQIKSFVLNFGDDNEETSIKQINNTESATNTYFTLDGRRLNDKPATAGLYIINGKKVVIK